MGVGGASSINTGIRAPVRNQFVWQNTTMTAVPKNQALLFRKIFGHSRCPSRMESRRRLNPQRTTAANADAPRIPSIAERSVVAVAATYKAYNHPTATSDNSRNAWFDFRLGFD